MKRRTQLATTTRIKTSVLVSIGIIASAAMLAASAAVLSPKQDIKVNSPNGGETWEIGKNYSISWTAVGYKKNDYVNVQFFKGSPALASPHIIFENIPAAEGTYEANLDPSNTFWEAGASYYARADLMRPDPKTNAGKTVAVDYSDALFKAIVPSTDLSYIKMTSPNGGEKLKLGQNITIQIQSKPLDIRLINIGYMLAGSAASIQNPIVWFEKDYLNNGIYNWYVDFGVNETIQAKIYAGGISKGANNTYVQDCSDNYVTFSKQDQYIKIISPNGEEVLQSGGPYKISWNYVNTEKVSLRLICSNGSGGYIATFIPNSGSYGWSIIPVGAATFPAKCKIGIEGSYNNVGYFTDVSDNWFSID